MGEPSPRPKFSEMLQAFRRVHGAGSLSDVAAEIGGLVKQNIETGAFENGCALRLSYAFHYGSKVTIPTSPRWKTNAGGDRLRYIYRVADMLTYLSDTFGPPDFTAPRPTPKLFANKQGILVFSVKIWDDASGHATLWDGKHCADHCYFPVSSEARIWLLP